MLVEHRMRSRERGHEQELACCEQEASKQRKLMYQLEKDREKYDSDSQSSVSWRDKAKAAKQLYEAFVQESYRGSDEVAEMKHTVKILTRRGYIALVNEYYYHQKWKRKKKCTRSR
ncbi:hypothetical protein PsorP6_002065 [Peronosclerospora sorghi]|uniref:Uncharacterized protein n=1 Tax=Peronosclerospora sorghi TaxID=230839 RepID=A0ACC0WUZ2_9STRA|nr:hypothetical protein PsorP6_002065 [Peronosclerospora sorghi]